MKQKNIGIIFISVAIIFSAIGNSFACTSLMITDVNGNAYHGRTLEFSSIVPTAMTYMPAGTKIESFTPTGSQGKIFNTNYVIFYSKNIFLVCSFIAIILMML